MHGFYAMNASVEGKGVLGKSALAGSVDWTIAVITCEYRPVDFAVLDNSLISSSPGGELARFCTRKYAFAADYLTLEGAMKYVTRPDHTALQVPPAKITGNITKTITWHEVPAKIANPFTPQNIANITTCLGKVNTETFDGNLPGTVLFVGVDPQMVTPKLSTTQYTWEISLSFLVRDNGLCAATGEEAGHQYRYDTPNQRWDLITSDGTLGGPRVYETADLNNIFVIT